MQVADEKALGHIPYIEDDDPNAAAFLNDLYKNYDGLLFSAEFPYDHVANHFLVGLVDTIRREYPSFFPNGEPVDEPEDDSNEEAADHYMAQTKLYECIADQIISVDSLDDMTPGENIEQRCVSRGNPAVAVFCRGRAHGERARTHTHEKRGCESRPFLWAWSKRQQACCGPHAHVNTLAGTRSAVQCGRAGQKGPEECSLRVY